MLRHRAIERKATRRLPDQRQRRRGRLIDVRTHAPGLRLGDRERGRERVRRGVREVGDGRVEGVGRDGVEGGVRGEIGREGVDGREGGDGEHGILEREVLARDLEAGEAVAGLEGEGEGVGVGGAPDAGSRVGGGGGGRGGRCGRFPGAVDEGDAFWFVSVGSC